MKYFSNEYSDVFDIENSPIVQATQEIINPLASIFMQEIKNSSVAQFVNPPAIEVIQNIAENIPQPLYMQSSPEYVAQLNSAIKQIGLLPPAVIQKFEILSIQNRSELLETVKINLEPLSLIFEQGSENNIDETIILQEPVIKLITSIDNSIKLPMPDNNKQIHIKKSNIDYSKVISIIFTILGTIFTIYGIYQNNLNSELSEKNYSEQIKEEHSQTIELQKQTKELQKQNKILEELLNSVNATTPTSISSTQHKD